MLSNISNANGNYQQMSCRDTQLPQLIERSIVSPPCFLVVGLVLKSNSSKSHVSSPTQ